MKRRIFASLICALPLAALAYPDKPIRLIVPMAAGSITDVVARTLADAMAARLHQPIVVDNQASGGNVVGTMAAVRAAPDGYTLLMVGVTNGASNLAVMKALPYDPRKDFTPVGLIADAPFLLVSAKALPVGQLKDLIAYGKAHPGKLSYGYGSGSSQLSAARFVSMSGITATAVPYKGIPQAMTDLIGGTIDWVVADLVNGLQAARAGRVTALGVTSAKRSPLAPDVPTLAEQGLPGYDISVWFGLAAPAHMPAAVVTRLNVVLREALADPQVRQRFDNAGLTASPSSPEAFGRLISDGITKWSTIARDAGVAPQ
ncbi:Bug family tripartite tricarboxylate transporter substrate binding protein [Paracidovorax anthurii]|uniref:Tripartite-type tricarboxylate transporter receptor subunit TctC n=1 Tax=Paracidovorax anthurii TaxID=78229 RepID=A0A328YWR5_9BURK|nr:tripartite tricarboxylate transporter substrate binding protein [Paracidovorax anthurii]RAR78179.1 tripartite-type tricarboxylate transporter receptor subunit TctC [Paracidovorax anthurii]